MTPLINSLKKHAWGTSVLLGFILCAGLPAYAQSPKPKNATATGNTSFKSGVESPSAPPPRFFAAFPQQSGKAIYEGVCAGCHMPDAKGATGAGSYPALAGDPKLEVAGYPVAIVTNGFKGMPAFGRMMSDEQIANVINYVRTNFGNNYKDKVTVAEVKAARQ